MDVLADGMWEKTFTEKPEVFTKEEKRAWLDQMTDVTLGSEMCIRDRIKYGPHGRFLACPGFPECKNTKPYFEKIGVACPKCRKEIVLKKTKKGRKYYGCCLLYTSVIQIQVMR